MARTGILEADQTDGARLDAPADHRRLGLTALALGLVGCAVWLGWRIATLELHPVPMAFLVAEIVGVVGAVAIAVGLIKAGEPRNVYSVSGTVRDCHRFAHAIADIVGRTRSADLHRDVRTALRAAPRWRPRDSADAAIAAVLADGPRRLTLVVTIGVGLLLGVPPFGVPPWWALGAALIGYLAFAMAHVALGRRRLRFGDRQRWSYGAIGEIIAREDVAGHAPRTWAGPIAVTVALSVAVALRGMSDRWTHGLPGMEYDERVGAMFVALALMLGALHTILTSPRPLPADVHLVSRRLEEATARQTLLAAAVCVGVIGLFAGVLPTSDQADEEPAPSGVVDRASTDRPEVDDG